MFLNEQGPLTVRTPGASSSCYMSFGMILADYSTMEPKDYWPMLCSSLETAIFSSVITYSTCHKLSPVLTCECPTHVGFTAGFPLWQSVDVYNPSTEAFRGSHSVGYIPADVPVMRNMLPRIQVLLGLAKSNILVPPSQCMRWAYTTHTSRKYSHNQSHQASCALRTLSLVHRGGGSGTTGENLWRVSIIAS